MLSMTSLSSRSDTDSRIASLPSNIASLHPFTIFPNPTKTFAHVMTHVL